MTQAPKAPTAFKALHPADAPKEVGAPEAQDSLISYQCDFPIKVMGKHHADFAQTLTEVVKQFDPDFDPVTIEFRPSKSGNYMGLTFTVKATSREQLDALYRAVHGHHMVKVVL